MLYKFRQINNCLSYLDIKTLDKLSEIDRLKFEKSFPGVIDKVISKSGQLTVNDIIDSYGMLDKFIDFDNHKLLFRNIDREHYIDMLYDYSHHIFPELKFYSLFHHYF